MMLQHNEQWVSLDYVEESVYRIALQGWHDIPFAKADNLLSAIGRQHYICTAQCVCLT